MLYFIFNWGILYYVHTKKGAFNFVYTKKNLTIIGQNNLHIIFKKIINKILMTQVLVTTIINTGDHFVSNTLISYSYLSIFLAYIWWNGLDISCMLMYGLILLIYIFYLKKNITTLFYFHAFLPFMYVYKNVLLILQFGFTLGYRLSRPVTKEDCNLSLPFKSLFGSTYVITKFEFRTSQIWL